MVYGAYDSIVKHYQKFAKIGVVNDFELSPPQCKSHGQKYTVIALNNRTNILNCIF